MKTGGAGVLASMVLVALLVQFEGFGVAVAVAVFTILVAVSHLYLTLDGIC